MKVDISYRTIWSVAYPIILGSVAQNILNITDTAFLGRIGEVALGGSVLGGLLYHVVLMLGWGLALGGQIIIARRVGEGAHNAVGRVVEHLFYAMVLLSLILVMILFWFYPLLFDIAVMSKPVQNAANSYFSIRIIGLLFAFTTYTYNAFLVGIARTKVITFTSFITVIINVVLDYGLIFGRLGLPALGVTGAALASVIAEVVGCIFLLVYVKQMEISEYNLFQFGRLSPKLFARLVNISWPLMLQFFISIFVWFIFFLFIEKMGEAELAVSNIIRSIYIILMIPIWGFASATNTLVSQQIGKGNGNIVLSLVKKVMGITLISVFCLSIITLLFSGSVIKIYTNDIKLIALAKPVIWIVAFASLTLAAAFISFNGVSGTGSTRVSFAIEVFTLTIYLSWAYIMAIIIRKPLSWVWVAEIVYGVLVTFFSLLYLKSGTWRNRAV